MVLLLRYCEEGSNNCLCGSVCNGCESLGIVVVSVVVCSYESSVLRYD